MNTNIQECYLNLFHITYLVHLARDTFCKFWADFFTNESTIYETTKIQRALHISLCFMYQYQFFINEKMLANF